MKEKSSKKYFDKKEKFCYNIFVKKIKQQKRKGENYYDVRK
jgi:hypothetical protein